MRLLEVPTRDGSSKGPLFLRAGHTAVAWPWRFGRSKARRLELTQGWSRQRFPFLPRPRPTLVACPHQAQSPPIQGCAELAPQAS